MTIALTILATLVSACAAVTWLQRGGALPYGPGSVALALWVTTVAIGAWGAVAYF